MLLDHMSVCEQFRVHMSVDLESVAEPMSLQSPCDANDRAQASSHHPQQNYARAARDGRGHVAT